MEAPSCMQTIQNRYHQLTAAEKRIADYLLHHREEVVGLSIGELAEKHGFKSLKTLNQCFRNLYGCTPSEKRKQLRMRKPRRIHSAAIIFCITARAA